MIVFYKGKVKRLLDIPIFGKGGDKRLPLILTPDYLNTFMVFRNKKWMLAQHLLQN